MNSMIYDPLEEYLQKFKKLHLDNTNRFLKSLSGNPEWILKKTEKPSGNMTSIRKSWERFAINCTGCAF